MNILSGLYGHAAGWRRAWYRPSHRRQHLGRPVISIGNLVVGGSGKTPTVVHVARLLQSLGERPAILSRGYARRQPVGGVVVVSDGVQVRETVACAGDEPLLLARALPGVPVLVARERHQAGAYAETHLPVTVHLLDDGYQHLQLRRDVDLLLMAPADVDDQLLPAGRLREPLAAALDADALIVRGTDADAATVAARIAVPRVFRLDAAYEAPVPLDPARPIDTYAAAFAVAGIAMPRRFFDALAGLGVRVAGELTFRDHHWYTAADVARIDNAARAAGASWVVTTEKDAVRLETLPVRSGSALPWATLPMEVRVEPAAEFATWLAARLRAAREGRPS